MAYRAHRENTLRRFHFTGCSKKPAPDHQAATSIIDHANRFWPRAKALVAFVAVTALPAVCLAVGGQPTVIHWGTAQDITGDSDVLNTGVISAAYSFGSTGDTGATVNGVTFAPFVIPNDSSSGALTIGNYTFTTAEDRFATNTAFGSTATPFSSLSSSYKTLLSAGTASGPTPGDMALMMSGLTIAKTYSFEWWSNDAALALNLTSASTGADGTSSPGNTQVFLTDNVNNTKGSPGQFDVGSFTAATTSVTIDFASTSTKPDLNAFLLESFVAPEPASSTLVACGLAAYLCTRSRRRRHV